MIIFSITHLVYKIVSPKWHLQISCFVWVMLHISNIFIVQLYMTEKSSKSSYLRSWNLIFFFKNYLWFDYQYICWFIRFCRSTNRCRSIETASTLLGRPSTRLLAGQSTSYTPNWETISLWTSPKRKRPVPLPERAVPTLQD